MQERAGISMRGLMHHSWAFLLPHQHWLPYDVDDDDGLDKTVGHREKKPPLGLLVNRSSREVAKE